MVRLVIKYICLTKCQLVVCRVYFLCVKVIAMRNKYLSQWKAYPTVPDNMLSGLFGQLILLMKDSGTLRLRIKSEYKDVKVLPNVLLNNEFSPFEVLRPGDKLAVTLNSSGHVDNIILLAPNLCQDFKTLSSKVFDWYKFLNEIRTVFLQNDFVEVYTPNLVANPGMEPHLRAFKTTWNFGKDKKNYYLPTSPEIHLKKLLSQGMENIFEIKACFRNEERSEVHSPEFHMLEWYRAYTGLDAIELDLKRIFSKLLNHSIEFKRYHLRHFYESYFKADWSEIFNFEAFKLRAEKYGFSSMDMTWNDLFSWFQVTVVEPELKKIDKPVILYGFPDLQPSLARNLNRESERFELYWKGVELANAYHELNDPVEQEKRWLKDQDFRRNNNLDVYELDYEFLEALKMGMPPSSGIALGLERLFMVLNNIENIQELSPFQQKDL